MVQQGHSGIPEVLSGIPSPPESPPLAALASLAAAADDDDDRTPTRSRGKGGAAYTITEESERLFCDTLRAVFLGERKAADAGALVMGAFFEKDDMVREWVEVWDYVGAGLFRGFVVGGSLVVFLDEGVGVGELKPG